MLPYTCLAPHAARRRGAPLPGALSLGLSAVLVVLSAAPPAWAGGRVDPQLRTPPTRRTPHPTLGDPAAPVTVMVFGDFQCPYSQRLIVELRRLVKDHPRKVKLVWRDFPLAFHREAKRAALAGREVFRQKGNAAYWAFHQLVFSNPRGITDAQLGAWATQVGANGARVMAAIRNGAHSKGLDADLRAARQLGVRGTPDSRIFRSGGSPASGKHLSGSRPYHDFKTAVDAL